MAKYFKDSEIVGLEPKLVNLLDRSRGISGVPYYIISGKRTPKANKAAGGADKSAHLKGLAADLACSDMMKRTRILFGLLTSGIPCFIEIAGLHIHVDVDDSIHPMGATIWGNDPS